MAEVIRAEGAIWCSGDARPQANSALSRATAPQPRCGLVLHGYGGDCEELTELASRTADGVGARVFVPDLPGHGSRRAEQLTLDAALAATRAALDAVGEPAFVVAHSMGARLALLAGAPVVAALSMPGEAEFDGSPREMARVLRFRRVTESKPYAGLLGVLSAPVVPADRTLLLTADSDLATVTDLAERWTAEGVQTGVIAGADHSSIVDAPATADEVIAWLNRVLA